jgi:hypothetical protein
MKPKIKIQMTKADWILETIALIGLLLTIFLVIISYNDLPDIIPRHYTVHGQPDGFGEKSLFFILPATAMAIYVAMTLAIKYPSILNYPIRITNENASRQYFNLMMMIRIIKTLIILMLLYLTFATIQTGLGTMQGLGNWFLPLILLSILGTIVLFIHRGLKLR